MSENTNDQLEEQLASLTRWEGDAPGLWRRALRASGVPGSPAWQRFIGLRVPAVAAAAIVIVAVVAGGLMLVYGPDIAMESGGTAAPMRKPDRAGLGDSYYSSAGRVPPPAVAEKAGVPGGEFGGAGGGGGFGGGTVTAGVDPRSGPAAAPPPLRFDALEDGRHVVRKATIELLAADVRALFLKAAQLVSEANGEYVESSSLTGSGREAQADLTLRVRADRLSEVLNALRDLGTVESEQMSGEDVTSQVVDLEARLRNEQRVEAELLDLLESRQDAPLREILDLRQQLNVVRVSIERLSAQRQRIGRLISLATILVIIRPEDAPVEPEPKAGLGQYFAERMAASWGGGLRLLTNTIAGGLRLLVGGLLWWIALAIVLLRVRQYLRQQRKMQGAIA